MTQRGFFCFSSEQDVEVEQQLEEWQKFDPPPKVYRREAVSVGRVEFVLRGDVVPRTVKNFATFLAGEGKKGLGYKGTRLHRVVEGKLVQGGMLTKHGGVSIYGGGKAFKDENFKLSHDSEGVLSMANGGKNSNTSQFFFALCPLPHLDKKHVVFGLADSGLEVLRQVERLLVAGDEVTIEDCGLL